MVNTVLGPMETSEMGRTLMHEHAVCFDMALKKAFGKPANLCPACGVIAKRGFLTKQSPGFK